jgi:starvation-inducible DNA-binding protein
MCADIAALGINVEPCKAWSTSQPDEPDDAGRHKTSAVGRARSLAMKLYAKFEESAEDNVSAIDELGERVRMIGHDPPAHLLESVDVATVSAAAPHSTMRDMVEEADRNLLIVVKETRRGAKTADGHGDPGTVDLFSRFVQIHEKHEWWMQQSMPAVGCGPTCDMRWPTSASSCSSGRFSSGSASSSPSPVSSLSLSDF